MDLRLFVKDKLFWHYYKSRADYYPSNFKKAPLYFSSNHAYMNLVPSDHISQQIAFTGAYEYELSKKIIKTAKMGNKVLVDVGANLGYFSILFASANTNNKVFAFEASPRNHDLLTHNINMNNLDKQIKMVPMAAGRETGKMLFSIGNAEQTGWGGLTDVNKEDNVVVDVVTLDQYFKGNDIIIDVLKIDVEGADSWVLEGANELLKEVKIREIYYEENINRMQFLKIQGGTAKRVLESYGYKVQRINEGEFHAYRNSLS